MQLVILGEQSVILSNQLFPLPYLLLPNYALYSDECLQSPFKILSVTVFVLSTFNSSSKFIFTKLHWLQFPNIAQFRSTVFYTLCLILNVTTHIIMTWFSFTDVHINTGTVSFNLFFSLVAFSDLLLSFPLLTNHAKLLNVFHCTLCIFFLFVQEESVYCLSVITFIDW